MSRSPSLAVVLLVALALVFALAGCGDSEPSRESSGNPSPPKLTQQDGAAKANARELLSRVESCFVDEQSYEVCARPSNTQLPLGSGSGQVEVSMVTDTGYMITAHSASGTNFRVAKDADGATTRTCTPAGTGGCPKGGTW